MPAARLRFVRDPLLQSEEGVGRGLLELAERLLPPDRDELDALIPSSLPPPRPCVVPSDFSISSYFCLCAAPAGRPGRDPGEGPQPRPKQRSLHRVRERRDGERKDEQRDQRQAPAHGALLQKWDSERAEKPTPAARRGRRKPVKGANCYATVFHEIIVQERTDIGIASCMETV